MTINLFTYGTLTFEEVARSLAGDVGAGQRAIINGFARYEATVRQTGNYPYVIASPGDSVEGILYQNITPRQLEIFDWFEGDGSWYHRVQVDRVKIAEEPGASTTDKTIFNEVELDVDVYVIGEELEQAIQIFNRTQTAPAEKRSWDPQRFYREHLTTYFQKTVIASVNDPDFKRKFGGPDDPLFIEAVRKKLG